MKIEKSIDKKMLKEFIQREYCLNVKNFIFVPKGEVAYSYILDCEVGKYFLKIHPKNSHLYDIATIINLELTSLLREKYGIENVTYPIKTKKSRLKTAFKGLEIIIFNFIDGVDLASRNFTIQETKKLAQLMAHIHQIHLDRKVLKKLEKEDFSIEYVEKGLKKLFLLTRNNNLKNSAQFNLKKYLLSNEKPILHAQATLRKFQQKAQKEKTNFVITHGDPIPSNIMADKAKNMYLIDWGSAKLAPIERDIWFYIEHSIGNFLEEYQRTSGMNGFNINIIGFYVYNRVLGDLIHWAQRIFNKNNPVEQSKADMEGILADCDFKKLRKSLKNMSKIVKTL